MVGFGLFAIEGGTAGDPFGIADVYAALFVADRKLTKECSFHRRRFFWAFGLFLGSLSLVTALALVASRFVRQ